MSRTSNVISNIAAINAGAADVIRPPVGEAWEINHFSNNQAAVNDTPDIEVGLYDGVTFCRAIHDPSTAGLVAGDNDRQHKFIITRDNYLQVYNRAAGAGNIGWTGRKLERPENARCDQVTVPAGATVAIQPPAGETWLLYEFGCSIWTAAAAYVRQDAIMRLTDGTLLLSAITAQTQGRASNKRWAICIDNTNYLLIQDGTGGAGSQFAYSGIRIPNACISDVQDIATGVTLDILPPLGTEWMINEFGAETWAGAGAPNNYPDMQVVLRVGANNSDILDAGSVDTTRAWNYPLDLAIDRTHFLRITNINGANNEVSWCGYVLRRYNDV